MSSGVKARRQGRVRLRKSKQVPPAEVKALFRAAGWTEDIAAYSPTQIRKLLRHSYLVLTAWSRDGKLVGFASAVSDGVLCGLVQNLVVHPAYRRNRLGTRLLRELASTMRRQGIPCLYALGTRSQRARTFFRRVGFHPLTWSVFLRHTRC
ncbi:MAG: GNAT family N-acetyltransferase [Acidobacteria bacterium]|nr:GNAT family N-acetyltransferase [Acidobacteriota bacterium]